MKELKVINSETWKGRQSLGAQITANCDGVVLRATLHRDFYDHQCRMVVERYRRTGWHEVLRHHDVGTSPMATWFAVTGEMGWESEFLGFGLELIEQAAAIIGGQSAE